MTNKKVSSHTEDNFQKIAIADEIVMVKIYVIKGIRVMLDRELAELYQVENKQLVGTSDPAGHFNGKFKV